MKGRPCAGRPKKRIVGVSISVEAKAGLRLLAARDTNHNQSAWIEQAILKAVAEAREYERTLETQNGISSSGSIRNDS